MSDEGEAFKQRPLDLVPPVCKGQGAQGASPVGRGEGATRFFQLPWEEGESGTALMSEPPSLFSQRM